MPCAKKLKSFFTLTEEGGTPPPWRMIGILFCALFSCAFTITFLFPFLPELILEFGYREEDKGYYAGLIATSYFLGRIIASYFWGWLSDKKGRRYVMLICICVNGLMAFAFGFSTNFGVAFLLRTIAGATSGTVLIVKTVLYEICDDSNQAVGMTVIAWGWGGGVIIGPAVGGFLAFPHKKYPSVFSADGFFAKFPTFLPCLVALSICLAAFVVVFFKMPETLVKSKTKDSEESCREVSPSQTAVELEEVTTPAPAIVVWTADDGSEENIPTKPLHGLLNKSEKQTQSQCSLNSMRLINRFDDLCAFTSKQRNRDSKMLSQNHRCQSKSEMVLNTSTDSTHLQTGLHLKKPKYHHSVSLVYSDTVTMFVDTEKSANKTDIQTNDDVMVKKSICTNSSFFRLSRIKDVRQSVALYTLYSFGVIGFDDVFTIFASTEPRLAGLGFSSDQIGLAMGSVFVPILIVQVFIYPKLERRFGAIMLFKVFSSGLMVLATIIPVIHLVYDQPEILWPAIFIIQVPFKFCTTCAFSSCGILINNSVSPSEAGSVNGLAMTVTAISRTIAPTFGGSLFAWSITRGAKIGYPFDVNCVFLAFGLVFMLSVIISLPISDNLNKQGKKEKIEK